jgi:hypothetical protein
MNSTYGLIYINRTYSITTEESAEDGESAENGFIVEDEPITFRELVSLMKDHPIASSSYLMGNQWEWLSSHPVQDYYSGAWTEESLHFSSMNHPRKIKYWRKALRCAGFTINR